MLPDKEHHRRNRERRKTTDKKAWDGMFYAGWRLVREGGFVMAGGSKYQHERLIPFVGKKIYVRMNDYWMGEILTFAWNETAGFICKAERVIKEQRR